MNLPLNTEVTKQDKGVFQTIFNDHWDEFKAKYPSYDNKQYEEPVQKMLGCGNESSGYSEYICMKCGRDLLEESHLAVRVIFVCLVPRNKLMILLLR